MAHPLGTRPVPRHTPLNAEEEARSEVNFVPLVAQNLVAKGQFRISADAPETVELFQVVARRRSGSGVGDADL